MNDEAQIPDPSPEVSQLVLLGQFEEAIMLYSKQAEIDPEIARVKLEELG